MDPSPELAVRLARAAFNRALADADLAAIESVLAPCAVLVAGTDSAVISGRKAQLAAWKREFAAASRTIYTRTPEVVTISPAAPIALEQGAWRGSSASDGGFVAGGLYTAKWRRAGADWKIEAEIFVTMA